MSRLHASFDSRFGFADGFLRNNSGITLALNEWLGLYFFPYLAGICFMRTFILSTKLLYFDRFSSVNSGIMESDLLRHDELSPSQVGTGRNPTIAPVGNCGEKLEEEAERIWQWEAHKIGRFRKLVSVLRHYPSDRIARRLLTLLRKKLNRSSRRPVPASPYDLCEPNVSLSLIANVLARDHAGRCDSRNTDLQLGSFCRLNQIRDLGNPAQWCRVKDECHLWRFQVHYHEFLLAHLATPDSRRTDPWEFVDQWLHEFGSGQFDPWSDAWHPYCLSRRIPVWLWLLLESAPPAELRRRMLLSLTLQTKWLGKNLERDIGGNHLLENLYALALASALARQGNGGDEARDRAQRFLEELDRQILPHGEHFERSPMYHTHILGNVVMLLAVLRSRGLRVPAGLSERAEKMLGFLTSIGHPDGEIPLFGDSGFEEALSVSSVRQLAQIGQVASSPNEDASPDPGDSPYWVDRRGPDFLIVDTGDVAGEGLPAHGHCDLLSLEGSIAGRRWIVDSGNFDYEDGPMRHFCRSSLGHNVVTLDRRNSCQVWSKFRMGQRCAVLRKFSGTSRETRWLLVEHDSLRLGGAKLARRVVLADDHFWLCADQVPVAVKGCLEGWLHLAPDLELRREGDFTFDVSRAGVVRRLCFFGCAKVEVFQGWYCTGFGRRLPNRVLGYEFLRRKDQLCGWMMGSQRFFQAHASEHSIGARVCDEKKRSSQFEWAIGEQEVWRV